MRRILLLGLPVVLVAALGTLAWGYCARMRMESSYYTPSYRSYQPPSFSPREMQAMAVHARMRSQVAAYQRAQAVAVERASQRAAQRMESVTSHRQQDAVRVDAARRATLEKAYSRIQYASVEERELRAQEWFRRGQGLETSKPEASKDFYRYALALSPAQGGAGAKAGAALNRLAGADKALADGARGQIDSAPQ